MARFGKYRILLIPDTIYWITGTMAREILKVNQSLDGVICSGGVVKKIMVDQPSWFEQFDLIHVLCPSSSRYILGAFLGKIPIVTTIHHVLDWDRVAHNVSGDMVMTVASEWKKYLLERGVSNDKITLVTNGVDLMEFQPVKVEERTCYRRKIGFSQGHFVVGYVGKRQLSKFDRKGIKTLENAIVSLASIDKNVAFVIVGPGWSSFVSRLRKQGITVTWYSYLNDHSKLMQIYSCMDCFWVTSEVEGGPVTLLEAMSCGLPCISTPVGIALDIIESGVNGILVNKRDPIQLVKETQRLISDTQLRGLMGQSARLTIQNKMSYQTVFSNVISLYEKAIGKFTSNYGTREPHDSIIIDGRWIMREEQLLWMDILKGLGEYRMAFLVGLKTIAQFPSLSVLKYLFKVLRASSF